jgi:hypothetical protein
LSILDVSKWQNPSFVKESRRPGRCWWCRRGRCCKPEVHNRFRLHKRRVQSCKQSIVCPARAYLRACRRVRPEMCSNPLTSDTLRAVRHRRFFSSFKSDLPPSSRVVSWGGRQLSKLPKLRPNQQLKAVALKPLFCCMRFNKFSTQQWSSSRRMHGNHKPARQPSSVC